MDFITSYVEVTDEETKEKALVANQTYKVTNKNARITDNVLHVTFDVKYSEIKDTTEVQMSEQTTNTSL